MAMAFHAGGQHLAIQGIECGKQGGGAMSLVIVGQGLGAVFL
jgi:hypothetical protein